MNRHAFGQAVAVVLIAAAPCSGRAQGRDAHGPTADDAFERAKALLKVGDWIGACAKFQQSFDLDASVSALVKIARCREHEGKPASARAEYIRALDLNRTVAQSAARARELEETIRAEVTELDSSVPRLRLMVSPRPSALEVQIDGHPVASADLGAAIAVDPGEREIVVHAPGYREERVRVTISAGASRDLAVSLRAEDQPAPRTTDPVRHDRAARPAGEASPATSSTTDAKRTAGLVVGGAGIAALAGAVYFAHKTSALVGDSRAYCTADTSACYQPGLDLLSDARQTQTLAIVLAGAGATLTGVGLVLYLTAHPAAATGPSAALSATFGPLGASMGGTW